MTSCQEEGVPTSPGKKMGGGRRWVAGGMTTIFLYYLDWEVAEDLNLAVWNRLIKTLLFPGLDFCLLLEKSFYWVS